MKFENSLDISRNRHTEPIPKATIDMKLEIFIILNTYFGFHTRINLLRVWKACYTNPC